MKKIKLLIFGMLVLTNITNISAQNAPDGMGQPEFYLKLTDNPGAYYRILATHYGNEPVYDKNFNYTTEYNSKWERTDADGNPLDIWISQPPSSSTGFDWVYDILAGEGYRGILGLGLYKIEIQRKEINVYNPIFTFYFDTRDKKNFTHSPDIVFYFDYNKFNKTMTAYYISDKGKQITLNQNDTVNFWEVFYLNKDWSFITQEIPVTNDVGGTVNTSLETKLLEKNEGFPVAESNYPIGYQFVANENVPFWKQATYKFEAVTEIVDNYKVRDWNGSVLSKTANYKLKQNDNSITAYYQPTYPLTVTNYLEGGSGGSYSVTWTNPNPDIQYLNINSGDSFYAFDFSKNNDYYKIDVKFTIPSQYGTDWQFQNWDYGSTNATIPNLPVTAPTTRTAYYKGNLRSDDAAAFANNGQRKVVRTADGVLHLVYESMGKIWYTSSSDNGANWSQEKLIAGFNGYNAKSPSLTADGNDLYITYWSPYTEGVSFPDLKVDKYTNGNLQWSNTIYTPTNTNNLSFNPSIAIADYFGDKIIAVVYRDDQTSELKMSYRHLNQSNWTNISIQNTDVKSRNPQIVGGSPESYYQTFHLVWEDSVSYSYKYIRYQKIVMTNPQITFTAFSTPSSGSGYTKNYNPTITVMDNSVVRVGWVGYRLNSGISKTNSSEKIIGTPEYRAVMRERTTGGWSGTFYKLSSSVKTVNINRSDDNNSIYAWVSSNGSSNQYMLNKDTEILGVISNPGDYLQLSGGSTTTGMKALKFETGTTPYAFSKTDITLSPPKTNGNLYSAGREGIISRDGAEFYFVIGDVSLDGNNVAFTPITNEADSSNYFSYLESESMNVNDNSALTYSVLYGFVDSLKVAGLLTKEKEVTFSVELVDANTEELLGVYDNVTYNSGNLYQYDNIAYSLNMNGIGSREVKLRLRIEENIGGKYTLADITAEEELLPKTSVKELSYQGELAVKEYSLAQNYPNPFNPSTTIKYQLPKNGAVKLIIYDMLGREVKTLVNGFRQKGKYEISFDASRLSSGVYIYRISANKFSASRKMMLIK